MAGFTDHYGFQKLELSEGLDTNGRKFSSADRDLIDRLLYLGTEGHHHDGLTASSNDPVDVLDLDLVTGTGSLPASTRLYYKYTVIDENGFESASSPEAFIDTPAMLATPAGPALAVHQTGGSLLPGVYFYTLTAWADANTLESKSLSPTYITVPLGTGTNRIRVIFPTLPAGADGFNIYRKKPGGTNYDYLTTIDMTVATPPTEFNDTGAILEDCDRTVPTKNTSAAQNSVVITIPDPVPVGRTWKIYRTTISGQYTSSLLHHVVEETFEGSGIPAEVHEDTGLSTGTGTPPATGISIGSPDPIDLTDASEVQGALPPGMVSGFPIERTFFFPGTLVPGVAESIWACPFEEAYVIGVVASLGRNSSPAATPVIVDVQVASGATPVFASVFADTADRPEIPVGDTVGTFTLATVGLSSRALVRGESLSTEIIQSGGGATPTDEDLTISILLEVKYGDALISTVWS